MPREIKRILYGIFYAAVLFGFLNFIYVKFLKPGPSCADKVKNQDEQGIDCGGVCGNICLPSNLKAIFLSDKVRFSYPVPAHVNVLFKLKNPNSNYLASFSYIGTVIGVDGSNLGSFSGDSLLYPGEDKYILVPNISFDNPEEIGHISVAVSNIGWEPSSVVAPDLALINASTTVYENRTEVEGNFANNEPSAVSRVSILAIFYNDWGLTIGATKTEYLNVGSGEKKQFTVIYPVTNKIDAAKTEVFLFGEH